MRDNPGEAALALLLEARAVMLNPNSKLYGTHSLLERLIEAGNTLAVELFTTGWKTSPGRAVYDVRRIYFAAKDDPSRKGTAWRSVKPLFTGTATEARAWLAAAPGDEPADEDGRVWLRPQDDTALYPKAERFLVATAAGVREKERASFAQQWQRITGEEAGLFEAM
jgi:hypothetical protein